MSIAEHGRKAPRPWTSALSALVVCAVQLGACGSDESPAADAEVVNDAGSDDDDDAGDAGDAGESADEDGEVEALGPALPSWGEVLIEDAVSISGDASGVCHVESSGRVLCRGLNDRGQLGNGARGGVNGAPVSTTADSDVLGIDDALEVLAVNVGARCALTKSGAVLCWGQVGDTVHVEPVALELPEGPGGMQAMRGVYLGAAISTLAVLTRDERVCARTAAGDWECAAVGPGARTFAAIPQALYVLDEAGSVFTCTLPSESESCTALALPAPAVDVIAFEDGLPTGLALLEDGTVACWGACPLDDPSDLTFVPEASPELVPGLDGVARLVSPVCTLDADDSLRCWGRAVRSGDANFYTRPELVGVLPDLVRLVGADAVGVPNLALTSDGEVRAIVWR